MKGIIRGVFIVEPLHFIMFWTLAMMKDCVDPISFYIQSTLILDFFLVFGQVTLEVGGDWAKGTHFSPSQRMSLRKHHESLAQTNLVSQVKSS